MWDQIVFWCVLSGKERPNCYPSLTKSSLAGTTWKCFAPLRAHATLWFRIKNGIVYLIFSSKCFPPFRRLAISETTLMSGDGGEERMPCFPLLCEVERQPKCGKLLKLCKGLIVIVILFTMNNWHMYNVILHPNTLDSSYYICHFLLLRHFPTNSNASHFQNIDNLQAIWGVIFTSCPNSNFSHISTWSISINPFDTFG